MSDQTVDVAVIGAGIVGLAAALQLKQARPDLDVAVFDKEPRIAAHQSSHNSGVLHAGVYYQPGSLKARLCREGKIALEQYATERGIPFDTNGKLIVAVHPDELDRLDRLEERARENGVPGLERIGPEGIADLEPEVRGLSALHSPTTGVIDFERVTEAFRKDLEEHGTRVVTGFEVEDIVESESQAVLVSPEAEVSARVVLACAGLQSDRLARLTKPDLDVRIVPFRGSFCLLAGDARTWVRGNVYPVPDPRFPFLGVHFTRRLDGDVSVGPNAFLSLAREGYSRGDLNLRDLAQVLSFGGFWRFAGNNVRTAWVEARREFSRRALLAEARQYLPGLEAEHLAPGPAGIRAQAMTQDGKLVDDFHIVESSRTLHVVNAPSPAATASLAIGRVLTERLLPKLG